MDHRGTPSLSVMVFVWMLIAAVTVAVCRRDTRGSYLTSWVRLSSLSNTHAHTHTHTDTYTHTHTHAHTHKQIIITDIMLLIYMCSVSLFVRNYFKWRGKGC